jgi:pilin isopeptide linkage protein
MNGVGKNVILYADDCDVEDYSENGKNYSKVSLYIKDLSRFETISGGVLKKDTYNPVVGTGHGGYAYGRITVKITAKVDAGLMASLSEATKVTNTAILTDNKYLPTGGVTATGDATIPATGSTVLSKSQASTDAPAYVQFALDINTGAMDLVANDGTLAIDDVMGSGMTMATSHKNCFRVYDVTNVSDLYKSDGSVDSSKAATGSDITEQCSWEATKEANTYRFTVPDATHVVIVYWASYSGVAGQKVQLANNAYFYYEGKDYSNNSSKWSAKLQVSGAGGDAYTDPYFFLQKQDQWGNNVSGAVFGVYKYVAGGDDVLITTRTTENGQAYIGHRSDDSFAKLELNTVYAIKEIQAPVGYTLDSTEHYFEFVQITGTGDEGEVTEADIAAHAKNHPTGITVVDISPGGTYTVTNTFTGASLTIPVVKTINGKNLSSTTEFSFTLKQTSGATVYTDTDYKKAVSDQGMTVTIKGSGSDCYTLYFKTLGDYTFTLTEDDLSDAAKACGYSEKDSTEYQVKVTVGTDPDTKQIKVTSATFTPVGKTGGDILNGNVLTFNNKLSLEGSLSLQVKKIVSGRTAEVRDGEFSFNVLKNGEVITDSKGNALVFKTQEGGLVNITIPLTQEDIGTQDYVIKEVVPTGSAADSSISYVASPVIATVTISEIAATANAKAHVAATSDVTYTAEQTDKSGVALMVNKYSASGSITLVGSKIYTQLGSNKSLDIGEKQFTFTVKEGNTIVATGYTETNGDITFTPINYIQTDVGEHTYTITEDSYTTPFIDFDDTAIKVKVVVTDLGGGKLKAEVADTSDTVIFHNTATTLLPTTGIRLDVLPYVLILILALGCGALMLRRRKHTRG